MNGKWTFYFENGSKKKEGSLLNGKADGLWVFYDKKANKVQEGSFHKGQKKENGQHGLQMAGFQRDTI